jgi:hypothetical protein
MAEQMNMDPTTPPADADLSDDKPGASGLQVLFTVLCDPDGTYHLIPGDEDEGTGAADQGVGMQAPAGMAGAAGGASEGLGDQSTGQTFDSMGALLKAILDLLKAHEASASGEGSEDDNFNAGYAGGGNASPPKQMMGGPNG